LRRARAANTFATQTEEYEGGRGNWLAPLLPPEAAQLTDVALAQRAEPNAWCAIILIVAALGLAAGGLASPHLLVASGLLLVGALLAVALNRASVPGWSASALVVAGMAAPVAVALLSAPGDPALALALDALVVAVLLAGVLLSSRAPLLVGGVGALACALVLLPRQFGHEPTQSVLGPLLSLDLLAPVGLIALVTLIAWLWATAAERALARTATTAAAMARYSSLDEQQAHVDRGVQALLATLAQVANGNFGARVDSNSRTVLWQLAAPLNSLITRLATSAQADQRLRATERAIDQLAAALEQSQSGQMPLWPSASGTRADRLTGLLATTTPRMLPAPPTPALGLGTSPHPTAPLAAHIANGGWPARATETPSFLPTPLQHRAPEDFARDAFAESYPAAPPATNAHAAARRLERRWASHPLPPLDSASLAGTSGATGSRPPIPRPPRPNTPSWPLDAPAVPVWLTNVLNTPDRRAGEAPPMPPATPSKAPAPVAASERKPGPEVEWSATGEVEAVSSVVPPAPSWTIVPVVPAEVERPEWPDFLITLDAVQHGQGGEEDDT
jgi:hypothetical protein